MLVVMTIHRLSNVDETRRTADCTECGLVTVRIRGRKRDGSPQWRCLGRLVVEHYLTEIDPAARTAFCRGCGQRVKVSSNPARTKGWACAVKLRADQAAYRKANPESIAAGVATWRAANKNRLREGHLLRTYNLTGQQFAQMLALQGGHCLFCPATRGNARNSVLHIDHEAESGLLRGGLLCDRCNRAIGYADHDPVRLRLMAEYLEIFRARTQAAGAV